MKDINLKDLKRVYFSGIGGISMSGIAEILHKTGYIVSGSDIKETEIIERLRDIGVKVYIGQEASNVTDGIDLLVYSSAVKLDNPEITEAKKKNIEIVDRAFIIGKIMKEYEFPICVSGTHGKTTTTSIISEILLTAEKDPTISLGGILPSIKKNFKLGKDKNYFVLESCEYYDSFLKFYPLVGVVLNIEEDHLDYFKDMEHIEGSFRKFATNIPKEGLLVVNHEVINNFTDIECGIESFGNKDCNWRAENIVFDKDGFPTFDVIYNNKYFLNVTLRIRGNHNILNTLSSIAVANFLNISKEHIKSGIESFRPPLRRFETKGEINGLKVIDDYAHHPTEIAATLEACKTTTHNKLWCVFQPHTYSRTISLLNEFANAFKLADNIIILDIYAARELNNEKVHSKDLVELLKNNGKNAYYFDSFASAEQFILKNFIHDDMLITMGAGDVYLLGESILHTELSTISADL